MMKEQLIKVIINGLHGKNTHISPEKAIADLSPEDARKKPKNSNHSCWELLHHIVIWQEAIFEAIEGKEVDWREVSKNHNWPSDEYLSDDSNYTNLVDKFLQGLSKSEELVNSADLHKSMPAWDDAPVIQAFMVLLQHNSYHLGQIITTRKNLGLWTL
jgi:uncharacterized damage-inducible protein DinB